VGPQLLGSWLSLRQDREESTFYREHILDFDFRECDEPLGAGEGWSWVVGFRTRFVGPCFCQLSPLLSSNTQWIPV